MTLIEETRELYNKVKTENTESWGHIWKDNHCEMIKIFNESNSAEEAICRISRTFMYGIDLPDDDLNNKRVIQRAVEWMSKEWNFWGKDELSIEDSPFVSPENKFNGFSVNFFRCRLIAHFSTLFLKDLNSVIELGAGAGHLARIINILNSKLKYTIIDLPETLNFSYMHLKLCFPEKKILYVTESSQLEEECDIRLIPDRFHHLVKGNYDLFINTASMGEMDNKDIRKWHHFFQEQINVKRIFLLNRFLNTTFKGNNQWHKKRSEENACSVSLDKHWDIEDWLLEPYLTKCPYIETLHARYLMIIARRSNESKDFYALSKDLIDSVKDQDWYRAPKTLS